MRADSGSDTFVDSTLPELPGGGMEKECTANNGMRYMESGNFNLKIS